MIDVLILFVNNQIYELVALFYLFIYLKLVSFKSSLAYLVYFINVIINHDHDYSCEQMIL